MMKNDNIEKCKKILINDNNYVKVMMIMKWINDINDSNDNDNNNKMIIIMKMIILMIN